MFTARPSTDLNVHLCQVLWEVLALNIVHCELVTREEGPLKLDVASSSSSSSSTVQSKDQQTWGGRSAHWIALRELGKLAMFINIVPYEGNQGNKTE
jgi:E3 ubiquitin-protein ligase UBR1/E3 ubiquitin-protein ligase UBR3